MGGDHSSDRRGLGAKGTGILSSSPSLAFSPQKIRPPDLLLVTEEETFKSIDCKIIEGARYSLPHT